MESPGSPGKGVEKGLTNPSTMSNSNEGLSNFQGLDKLKPLELFKVKRQQQRALSDFLELLLLGEYIQTLIFPLKRRRRRKRLSYVCHPMLIPTLNFLVYASTGQIQKVSAPHLYPCPLIQNTRKDCCGTVVNG